ncbi:MAG TPA: putative Ig domain-containing protein, partial [Candidatus Sulfotelmatobacter sp.]|nr:putative Ig domain-containing protein [Candidatus Sulfotelmatobacter sp.]
GGNPPYVWRISAGALPGGLTISAADAIAGTPTESGSFTFTVEVIDASLATANLSGTITVAPILTASLARSGTIVIEVGHSIGAFGSQTGGKPPYTVSVTAGAVPPGTTLDGLSLRGSVSSAGNYSFTATVADSLGATASVSTAYYVFRPIAFPPRSGQWDATCIGGIDRGCTTQLGYSGGTPGTTPLLTWSTATPTLQPVPVPYANGHTDLATPRVSGGAVHVEWLSDRLGTGGGIGWEGVVIATLTDPVTGESTHEAHIYIHVA